MPPVGPLLHELIKKQALKNSERVTVNFIVKMWAYNVAILKRLQICGKKFYQWQNGALNNGEEQYERLVLFGRNQLLVYFIQYLLSHIHGIVAIQHANGHCFVLSD